MGLAESTEYVSMRELGRVVLQWEAEGRGPGVVRGELDVEEMFPIIHGVGQAVQAFFEQIIHSAHIPLREAFFKIHKGGIKRMDGIARTTRDSAFYFVPLGWWVGLSWSFRKARLLDIQRGFP